MARILMVADGRSPTALNWMRYFSDRDFNLHLVSIFPCNPNLDLETLDILPTFISARMAVSGGSTASEDVVGARNFVQKMIAKAATPEVRTGIRHIFTPRSLPGMAGKLVELVREYEPDVVHAMRIPYEGMLAALALQEIPKQRLLVSIWGNDFTLHAPANRKMQLLTRLTMQRADMIHSDCFRDVRLARSWGFTGKTHVLPGAGGVQTNLFRPPDEPVFEPVIINPRGLRTYVRNRVFFQAISQIKDQVPGLKVLCPAMAGSPQAENWVRQYDIADIVQLLPRVTRNEMVALYQRSMVVASPSTHDGTPNSLLEAIACGCFPVAGDIESIREWITTGVNGLLHPPADVDRLAEALLLGISSERLRIKAREHNLELIANRADYLKVMKKAEKLYR